MQYRLVDGLPFSPLRCARSDSPQSDKIASPLVAEKSLWYASGKKIALSRSLILRCFFLSLVSFLSPFCCRLSLFFSLFLLLENAREKRDFLSPKKSRQCANGGKDHALPAYAVARFLRCLPSCWSCKQQSCLAVHPRLQQQQHEKGPIKGTAPGSRTENMRRRRTKGCGRSR